MPEYTPDEFARLLLAAGGEKMPRAAVQVLRRGLLNVKNDARRNAQASSGTSAARAPQTIGYDEIHQQGLTMYGAVEYLGGGQANLGTVLEFGGGKDHSPPHHDLRRALEAEEPKFVQAMTDAAEEALE